MARYFDNREQRWRQVPNCGKVNLAWSELEQRCVRPTLKDMMHLLPTGLGLLGDDGEDTSDWWDTGDCVDCSDDGGGGGFDWGGGDTGGDGGDPGYVENPDNPDDWTLTNPDGSYDYHTADGAAGGCDAAGECYYVGPNGEIEYTGFGANGQPYEYYEDASGNWTSHDPATGLTCTGDSSGTGYCTDASGQATAFNPGAQTTGRQKAQQKAQDAAGKSAAAGSSGGGGGQKQSGQPGQTQTAALAAQCAARGGQFNTATNQCVMPQSSTTVDAWFKKNFNFGAGTGIAIIAALLIAPAILKKL